MIEPQDKDLHAENQLLKQQIARLKHNKSLLLSQLQTEKNFTKLYLDHTDNIVVFIVGQGEIHLVNRRSSDFMGMSRDKLIGQNWFDLALPKEVREERRKKFITAMNGQERVLVKSSREHRVKTSQGSKIVQWYSRIIYDNDNQPVGELLIGNDVTEQREDKRIIEQMAYHDQLTGIPNRLSLQNNLPLFIQKAKVQDWSVSLFFLDFDNFKACNDNYGHSVGDQLLKKFTERLAKVTRSADMIARLGGDEFVLILNELDKNPAISRSQSTVIAKRIHNIFQEPFELTLEDKSTTLHQSGVSIGIAFAPFDTNEADQLLTYADNAMYEAKRKGKNRFEFYSDVAAQK